MKRHAQGHSFKLPFSLPSPRLLFPLFVLLVAGFSLVLFQWAFFSSGDYNFSVGAPSPQTYRVIVPMRYNDQAAAGTLREMAADSVVSVTVRDLSAKVRLQRRLEALHTAKDPAQEGALSYVPEALLNAIARMDEADRTRLLNLAAQVGNAYIDRLEAAGVFMEGEEETSLLWEEIGRLVPSVEDANLVYQILAKLGNLTLRSDPELTDRVKQAAANDIPAVDRHFEIGDVIVARDEIITPQTARLLRLQGYTEDVFPVAELGVVFVLVMLLPVWLSILSRDAGGKHTSRLCVVVLVLIAWVGETLGARLHLPGAGVVPAVLAASLCIHGPFSFGVALTGTATGAFIITNLTISSLTLILAMAVVASTAGFYLLRNPESRGQVNRGVFLLTLLMALTRLAFRWLQGLPEASEFFLLSAPGWAFWAEYGAFILMELVGAHIIIMLLPVVEESLGVLSILRLRELSHPSSPLLRTLQHEAPGTYQHCLTIATLIESVAMELGMDVNLVKAGAYYHDIGKLRRPQFYVENQRGGPNTHDEMSPTLSAITIISHVNEGLQMAWDAKLPRRIRDFIAEHHGTTCVRYFYNKARASGEKVEWSDFCYPGPKPQSRETALLMIVDSTEAAVRSMNLGRGPAAEDEPGTDGATPHPNRGRSQYILALQQVIDQVVGSKAGEGQFSEVNFTQRDITQVKASLLSALLSMYHTRRVKRIEKKAG